MVSSTQPPSSALSVAAGSSVTTTHTHTTTLTAIEQERLANIQRNQQVLESVGLGGSHSLLGIHQKDQHTHTKRKKKRPLPLPASARPPPTEPSRRSLRNLGKEAPDYREAPDIKPLSFSSSSSSHQQQQQHKWHETEGQDLGPGEAFDAAAITHARTHAQATSSTPAPGSSRTMNADVSKMLNEYLGKKVPYTGKQCVMDLLAEAGAGHAKFSKYAGVVEWKNCVVLWVNVDGGDYDNLFLREEDGGEGNGNGGKEEEMRMTWFAGSRVTVETPVMLRLLEAGKQREKEGEKGKGKTKEGEEGEKGGTEKEEILLFCRLQGEPYVFMGRVFHVWYETRRHPIKVIWKLRDYEKIKESEDVKEILGEEVEAGEEEKGKKQKK